MQVSSAMAFLALVFRVLALHATVIQGGDCLSTVDGVGQEILGAIPEAFMTATALQCCKFCFSHSLPT